jgi:hypothetical protein
MRPVGSVDPQLVEAVVVDPEVVRQLVDDGDPDLLGQVVRIGKVLLERQAKQRDPVRCGEPIGAVLGPRDTLVQAVESVAGFEVVVGELGSRRLVVDDDRDLDEAFTERRRDARESPFDELVEADVPPGRRTCPGPAAALRPRLLS